MDVIAVSSDGGGKVSDGWAALFLGKCMHRARMEDVFGFKNQVAEHLCVQYAVEKANSDDMEGPMSGASRVT